MLTHVFPRRGTKGNKSPRKSTGKGKQNPFRKILHFDKEKFAAVEKLYRSLQSESNATNKDVAASEDVIDSRFRNEYIA